ncbi:hypothetical protein LIT25_07260 [Bacillus sp. F19]|nr:hypothetical protein LIT25_07260 [Bacillus sp. F19]
MIDCSHRFCTMCTFRCMNSNDSCS